jgi:hypothetical protein
MARSVSMGDGLLTAGGYLNSGSARLARLIGEAEQDAID